MKHTKQSLISYFRRFLFLVRVEGESCWPYLAPGKYYWASAFLKPKEGHFIVFRNPKNTTEVFIKRAAEVLDGGYRAEGTVSWALSSNDFGLVPAKLLLGHILSPTTFRIISPDL